MSIKLCLYYLVLAVIVAIQPFACLDARGEPPPSYPYRVTTTVAMITDIVREVAGDRAQVQGIMKEGVDPHLYKPTRSDMNMLMSADVVFYNGLMLEGKMTDLLIKVARTGKPIHPVTELLLEDKDHVMVDPSQHYDPHVWMAVRSWMRAVQAVAKALGQYDPTNTNLYQANADRYLEQLRELDDYARRVIGSIPKPQRVLVTAHDAFQYFGRAYDIEVRGIQGLSTESEAGIKDINNLVNLIVDRRVRAVFVETSVADKNVKALVEGAAAKGHNVIIGGSLFSDAMGKTGTYEGTYIGMIDHNVTIIARALGGQVPPGGMHGRLTDQRDR